jgi:hypothetical protein
VCEKLGEYLDRIGQWKIFRKIFDRLAERRWWRLVFHHEAGHAVARVALFGQYNDMTAQNQLDDEAIPTHVRKASYGKPPSFAEFDLAPVNNTIVLAAGAQAEQVLFGINSDGFIGDRNNLLRLCQGLHHVPGFPMAPRSPQVVEAVNLAYQEIDAGFPQTQALLRRHMAALRAIGNASLEQFGKAKLFGKPFERRVILPAADVERLFQSHPPTD